MLQSVSWLCEADGSGVEERGGGAIADCAGVDPFVSEHLAWDAMSPPLRGLVDG